MLRSLLRLRQNYKTVIKLYSNMSLTTRNQWACYTSIHTLYSTMVKDKNIGKCCVAPAPIERRWKKDDICLYESTLQTDEPLSCSIVQRVTAEWLQLTWPCKLYVCMHTLKLSLRYSSVYSLHHRVFYVFFAWIFSWALRYDSDHCCRSLLAFSPSNLRENSWPNLKHSNLL